MPDVIDRPACWLEAAPHYQCCCNCAHRLPVFWHRHTKPGHEISVEGCCCDEQKGWACVLPYPDDERSVYDCWPEHSVGCELYEAKEKSCV